ncbi:MAG TPA: hypothetical protein DCE41_07630 [Cytophagales bacterium]|nr:hypothetical protein [Cytophagales bacterium]HAA24277.1 hypothetical protein [Cytophagales bacterium]HAP64330.1 hypothetical protein [Cytophagales bacterium]
MQDPGDFIGTGWSFPPAFGPQGAMVEMTSGEQEIYQSLEVLINTLLGERVLVQDFGCAVQNYVFEALTDTLLNEIRGNIKRALVLYESRVDFTQIQVTQDPDELGKVIISIEYTMPDSNSRYNLVYPYYLAEADNSV